MTKTKKKASTKKVSKKTVKKVNPKKATKKVAKKAVKKKAATKKVVAQKSKNKKATKKPAVKAKKMTKKINKKKETKAIIPPPVKHPIQDPKLEGINIPKVKLEQLADHFKPITQENPPLENEDTMNEEADLNQEQEIEK